MLETYGNEYRENKQLFDELGIKLSFVTWKPQMTGAHYSIEIEINGEKWDFDNGYAWKQMIFNKLYRIGSVFDPALYDPNQTKREYATPVDQFYESTNH